MRFGIPAQKPARGLRFDHWGAAKVRAPTWRDRTSLYSACPTRRATRIGRSIKFISPYLQPITYFSREPARLQSKVTLDVREVFMKFVFRSHESLRLQAYLFN